MRILLTGASGFIGSSLIEMKLFDEHELQYSNRNTDWSNSVGEFDVVIHLAGKAHDKGAVWDDFECNNIKLTEKILENLRKYSPDTKFVFVSTSKVYGEQSFDNAFKESDELKFETDYGKSKAICEQLVKNSGLEYIILRPPLVFGSTPKGNLGLIQKVASLGLPFPKNINNKRSLCSTDFVAKTIKFIINGKLPLNQIYNLSEYTVSTVEIFKRNGCRRFINYPAFLLQLLPEKIAVKILGNFEVDGSKLDSFIN